MSHPTVVGRFQLSSFAFAAALAALCAAGCSSLAGKIDDDRYHAPGGLFSVAVPKLTLGQAVEDGAGKHPDGLAFGTVSFHDDLGHVRSIAYDQMSDADAKKVGEPSQTQMYLSKELRDVVLPQIRQISPKSEILHQGPETLKDGTRAWFSVVSIPGGSTLSRIDADHPQGERLDSTRAFLLCFHDNLYLNMSAADDLPQAMGSGAPSSTTALDPKRREALKQALLQLHDGLRFD